MADALAAMEAAKQTIGYFLTVLVITSLASLAIVEFIGARLPGFHTISDSARADIAAGDYRLFLLVLALFLLGGLWWAVHILGRL